MKLRWSCHPLAGKVCELDGGFEAEDYLSCIEIDGSLWERFPWEGARWKASSHVTQRVMVQPQVFPPDVMVGAEDEAGDSIWHDAVDV